MQEGIVIYTRVLNTMQHFCQTFFSPHFVRAKNAYFVERNILVILFLYLLILIHYLLFKWYDATFFVRHFFHRTSCVQKIADKKVFHLEKNKHWHKASTYFLFQLFSIAFHRFDFFF